MDNDVMDKIGRAINGMGWNASMYAPLTTTIPASACDQQRVYVNWLGIGFAVDARTGKLLWRTDKLSDLGEKANMLVESMVNVAGYQTVIISKDLVGFVRVPLKSMSYQSPFRLTVHEAATGKQKWSSEAGQLTAFNFSGRPIVSEGLIFATAVRTGGADMFLLAINPENGKLEYQIQLGQATMGQNWRGGQTVPSSKLLAHEATIYVMTNNGALLAVSPSARRVEWAFIYEGAPISGQPRFWSSEMVFPAPPPPGALLVRDGVLYVKETGAEGVYAIDLAGPTLKWRRPMDGSESVAGVNSNLLISIGQDVCGIELDHQKMLWSARLPDGCTNTLSPILADKGVLIFAGRGIFQIDLGGGDVSGMFRGQDRDSLGGAVYTVGGKMMTVSNQAVTAYPLGNGAARVQ